MSWTSSATTGVSTRALGLIEAFFHAVGSGAGEREHWSVSAALKLRFPLSVADPERYLQRAWLVLRDRHPGLAGAVASTSAGGATQGTLSIGPFDTNKWLSNTFFVDTSHSDANALYTSFERSSTATCHWLPASQELVIHSSHWRIDGIGMLMLADRFMTLLVSVLAKGLDAHLDDYASSQVANESQSPSLDDLVKAPTSEEATPARLRDAADAEIATFLRGVPSIGLPTTPGSEAAPPGLSARATAALSAEATAAVVDACRQRGLSVNSAVHASIGRVVARYPQHPMAKSYVGFFPVDMRPHTPVPGPSIAVANFCDGMPLCIDGLLPPGDGGQPKSWADAAWEANRVYRKDLRRFCHPGDGGPPISKADLVGPFLRRTTQLFGTTPPPELPPVQTADLSTFGIIERRMQRAYAFGDGEDKVEVLGFWQGVEMHTRSLQCQVWTFRDELTLAGCFNESFYEREFVEQVLNDTLTELLQGLEIQGVNSMSIHIVL